MAMLTISRLFGRSPFAPLQAHMELVSRCVHQLPHLFEALDQGNATHIEALAEEISRLEHEADLMKQDIRHHLPKSLYLPIERGDLLEMLRLQDKIADKVEDTAILVTLKPLVLLPIFEQEFKLFVSKNLSTFEEAHLIVRELHELVESSFGGKEAEKVRAMAARVTYREHEVDLLQRTLLKKFFHSEDQLTYVTFSLWQTIFENVAAISNLSENLADRIRLTLELQA